MDPEKELEHDGFWKSSTFQSSGYVVAIVSALTES